MTTQTKPDLIQAYELMLAQARKAMWGVRADQIANRTPCTDWDVTALINHFTTQQLSYASTVNGAPVEPGKTPRQSLDRASDAILTAVRAPGGLDKIVQGRAGPIPASQTLAGAILDLAQHTWDLAKATGQDTKLDPLVVEAVLPNAEAIAARGPSRAFAAGPKLPANASRQDRFLALTGRDPAMVL